MSLSQALNQFAQNLGRYPLNQPKIKIIKNIKKIIIIKSWVEPTEENSRGDNDSAAIRGDNN